MTFFSTSHAANIKQDPSVLVVEFTVCVTESYRPVATSSAKLESEVKSATKGESSIDDLKAAVIGLDNASYGAMRSISDFLFPLDLDAQLFAYLVHTQRNLIKSYALRMSSMALLLRYADTKDSQYIQAYTTTSQEAGKFAALALHFLGMAHERVGLKADL